MNAIDGVRVGAHYTWAHLSARLSGLLCDLIDRDASVFPVSDGERELLIALCREWRSLREPRWYREACRRIGLRFQSDRMAWVYDAEAFKPVAAVDARDEAAADEPLPGWVA